MQWHYNEVNFLKNVHNIQPIAHPLGGDMNCFLWVQTLIHVNPELMLCRMKYHVDGLAQNCSNSIANTLELL